MDRLSKALHSLKVKEKLWELIFLATSLLFGHNHHTYESLILEMMSSKQVNLVDSKIQKALLGILKVVQSIQMVKKLGLFPIKLRQQDQQLVINSIFMTHKMIILLGMTLVNKRSLFKYSGIKNKLDILECKLKLIKYQL